MMLKLVAILLVPTVYQVLKLTKNEKTQTRVSALLVGLSTSVVTKAVQSVARRIKDLENAKPKGGLIPE